MSGGASASGMENEPNDTTAERPGPTGAGLDDLEADLFEQDDQDAPWRPPSAGAVARQVDREQLERRVADIGSTLRASSAEPAQVRLAQLRQRVLAKSSL